MATEDAGEKEVNTRSGELDADLNKDQDWQEVKSRRNQKRSTQQRWVKRKIGTTYFLNNLPEGCEWRILLQECKKFGEAQDVFVSKRKSRSGSNFGFVTFKDPHDRKRMEHLLCSIKLNNMVISANLAKFDRLGSPLLSPASVTRKDIHRGPQKLHNQSVSPKVSSHHDSYLHACLGKQSSSTRTVIDVTGSRLERSCLDSMSLIGRVCNVQTLNNVDTLISPSKGLQEVIYIGGFYVLMRFWDSALATQFLQDKKSWNDIFSALSPWEGQSLPYERISWLRIRGVPPHLWNPTTFDRLAGTIGQVIRGSETSPSDCDRTHGLVGVLVNSGNSIEDESTLLWNGKRFKIWFSETMLDWSPDFINRKPRRNNLESPVVSPENQSEGQSLEPRVNQPNSRPMNSTIDAVNSEINACVGHRIIQNDPVFVFQAPANLGDNHAPGNCKLSDTSTFCPGPQSTDFGPSGHFNMGRAPSIGRKRVRSRSPLFPPKEIHDGIGSRGNERPENNILKIVDEEILIENENLNFFGEDDTIGKEKSQVVPSPVPSVKEQIFQGLKDFGAFSSRKRARSRLDKSALDLSLGLSFCNSEVQPNQATFGNSNIKTTSIDSSKFNFAFKAGNRACEPVISRRNK